MPSSIPSGGPIRQRSGPSQGHAPDPGFTLIEVLIALAIATLALLLSLSLLWQQPRVLERLEARRVVQRTLEATMETLRAVRGPANPLVEGEVEWQVPVPELPSGLTLRLLVSETTDKGLYDVELEATWVIQHRPFQQSLHSLVWAP